MYKHFRIIYPQYTEMWKNEVLKQIAMNMILAFKWKYFSNIAILCIKYQQMLEV